MDKYYLFSKKVTHAVKVSITLAISLLLFAFSQAAVGHESGYSPTGANAPNSIATNVDVGIGQPYAMPGTVKSGMRVNQPVAEFHLTITGKFEAIYNGTTAFTFTDADGLDGLILNGIDASEPDIKLIKLTGTFATGEKNVGDNKTFSVTSYELAGDDFDHYDLPLSFPITADIKPIELTVSGITIDDKVYDGTTTAKLNYSTAVLAGPIILADNIKLLKLKPVGTFNSKVAGEKSVTITGFGIGDVIFSNDNHDNYILNILPLTANITKKPLTVSATCVDKVFDATTTATVSLTDNRLDGDVLAIAKLGASFATDHAGTTIPVTVEGISISGVDAANYSFNETASTTANITPKVITISGVTAIEKVYDDNNNAVLGGTATLVGVPGDEEVTLINGIGTFADEYAGVNKVVTFSDFRLEGSDKDNYILTQPPTVTAEIDKRELLIIATASDRDYDATTNASVILSDNRVSGDEFEIHTAPTNFVDKNAGIDKSVIVTGIVIDGDDTVNYTWNTEATTKATIKPIYLTISGVVVGLREYDGTSIAPIELSDATLVGNMIGSDQVSLNKETVTGTFANKNVGVDKPVTITGFEITALNDNKINYIITQPSINATIIAEGFTVTAEGNNKVYDGKTDAVVTLTPDPTEMAAGDVLTFTYDADFADKNAANEKTVNVNGITISTGNEAGNYILENTTTTATANITQKELSVIAVAMNKVYDGDLDADADVTLTPDPQDVAAGDVLTLGFAEAHFSDKNVATGKTVTVEGIEIKTGNAGNYFLESTTETPIADITPLDLTVNASVLDKVYNDNIDVVATTVTLTSTNMVGGDELTYAFSEAAFSDENVGDRTVFVDGIAISGTESVNYKLVNTTATVNAKITPKDLTVTAVGVEKVYDGTNKAVVIFTTPDLGDDVMEYDYTATFRDKDVDEDGDAIPVTVTNIILKGDEAGNYKLTNVLATTEAKITPRKLNITGVTADDKLYNGNTVVVLHTDNAILVDMKNPELNLIALDDVKFISDLAIGEFADKNAGLAKPINVSLFKIAGDPNEHNYSLVQPSPTANITPVKLRITGVTAEDKSYDGNKVATLNIGSTDLKLVGVLTGDTVALVSSTAKGEFEVKDVSEYQKVTTKDFTLAGDDAGNYEVIQPIALASITDKNLVLTATGDSKIYDSEDDATVTLTGWVANDDVRVVSYKAIFANDHVSDAPINITVTDIVLEGVDLKNYDFPAGISVNTEANITPRTLKIKGVTAENKAFNHSYTAILDTVAADLDAADLISGDEVKLIKTGATGTFNEEDVDTAIPVTTIGFDITGEDAVNYALIQPSTTADITPAILTISDVTANSKIYDGTDVANLNSVAVLNGVFSPDVVTLHTDDATAIFENKNAGVNKTVIVDGFTLDGTDTGNYSLTQPEYVKANISQRVLAITAKADNKEYDGTLVAVIPVGGFTMDNLVSPDEAVTVSATARFEEKDADEDKTVNITGITLGGTGAGNYTSNTVTTTIADITPATLKVTGVTAASRVYNGSTLATLSDPNNAQLSGVKSVSDDVTLVHYGVTSNFTDKNVGTDKSVLTTGFDIEGMDIVNYYLEQPSPKANINPIVLNITGVTADNKVYDGTTKATLSKNSAALVGSIIPNENVTLITDGADGTFVDENAGTGKSVTFNGISITGTDAGNYLLANTTVSGTANITPRTLAVSAVGVDKPYDGLPSATVTLTDNRVVGDILTIPHTAAFNDKNVGMGKPVTVSVLPITGTDAANYMLESTTATTTANISSVGLAALTITGVTVNSKVYDGTTTATLNTTAAALSGVISPDVVTLNKSNATGTFADKNVGTGIAVTTAGFAIGGADAGNYTMTNPTITNSITAKQLTVTPASMSKCFGATPTLSNTAFTTVGLVGNDAVTSLTLTCDGTLAAAAAGTYSIAASNAVGTGLSNYSVNYANGTMTVNPLAIQPADFAVSTASVCKGTLAVAYSVPNDPLVTYNWSYSGAGATINGSTNAVTLDFSTAATSGTLSVTANTDCGASVARTIAITTTPAQAIPVVTVDALLQVTMTCDATAGIQWYNTTGAISGATAQNYTAPSNGDYYVKVTGSCATLQSNTVNITHVSIPEFEKSSINVYPNPNQGEFWVNFKASGNEKLKMIQVYNKLGKAVYQATPKSVTNEITERVSIKSQPAGVYILVLTTDNQRISRQIIITK